MPPLDQSIGQVLPEELRSILIQAPLPGLGGEPLCSATSANIQAWLDQQRLHHSLTAAGLWLLAGELDKSHAVSQRIETAEGSFWHGIMHRREGDFGNSKYWMKRVGKHPVLEELAARMPDYRSSVDFVDFCERVVTESGPERDKAVEIQWTEWQLLFQYCWNQERVDDG